MGKGSSLKHYQMVANLSQGRRHGHQIYTGSLNLTLRHYQGKRLFFQLLQDRLCSATHSVNHSAVLIWDRIFQDHTYNRYLLVNCFCTKAGIWNILKISTLVEIFPPAPLIICENIFDFSCRRKHRWMVWTGRALWSALGSALETFFMIVVVEMLSLHSVANLVTDLLRDFC